VAKYYTVGTPALDGWSVMFRTARRNLSRFLRTVLNVMAVGVPIVRHVAACVGVPAERLNTVTGRERRAYSAE